MAIINSYPLATPKLTDLILGTSTSSNGQTATKSFTVESIKNTTIGVQTIITTIPATLNITGSGTANVTINTVTAAITSGGAALATGGDIYTFLTGKITGTPNTVPIWTDATTLGDSLISQANNSVIINGSGTDGRIQLNCSATTHGVGIQSPPHSASATYDWVLPQSTGIVGQTLTSGGGTTDQLTWTTPTPGKEYSLTNQQNGSSVELDLNNTTNDLSFNGFNPSSSFYYATLDPSLFTQFGPGMPLNSSNGTMNPGTFTSWSGNYEVTFNIGGTSYGPYTYAFLGGAVGNVSVNSSTFRVSPSISPLTNAYIYQFSAYADGGTSNLTSILVNFNSNSDSVTVTRASSTGDSKVTLNAAGGISLTSNSASGVTISSNNAAGTVTSVTSADTNTLTVANTTTTPAITAVTTGGVGSGKNNLATGDQIQTAIDSALAGAVTFKGTFNASTGQITGGSDYLYNPGANTNTIAVAVGDMYVVSVAGNFFGNSSTALNVGDEVIAVTQSTISPSNSQESYYNAVPSAGGGITGGGTTNKVPLWTGTTVLGNSEIAQSSSNIGIGTTSPANGKLQIDSATNQISIETGTSGDGRLQIGHFSNGAFIGTYGDDGGVGDVIRFGTHSGDERMRIDSSGNVGIGTSSPSAPLFFGKAVYGAPSSEDFYRIKFNDLGGVNNDVGVGQPDANSLGFNVEPAGAITFNRGTGGETMRIDSTGNVGIGTTSPSVSLDINDTDAIQVPAGTTAQRPTPANGMLRYSTTDNQFEGYADGAWGAIAGGGGLPTKTVNQITVANATTGTITLSVSPTNENYTDMYVSGVYQNKSTYTLSGSTITLDGGAYFPNGAIVEVVSTT